MVELGSRLGYDDGDRHDCMSINCKALYSRQQHSIHRATLVHTVLVPETIKKSKRTQYQSSNFVQVILQCSSVRDTAESFNYNKARSQKTTLLDDDVM
jgi:hypothetical protein